MLPSATLAEFERLATGGEYDLVSSDVFDTLLLRDHSAEVERFAQVGRRAAERLGVEAEAVVRLRWAFHRSAYLAVSMENLAGEARLSSICRAVAAALGLPAYAADVLRATEVEVDAQHLRTNEPLLGIFRRARRAGVRVVAVSDTYYSEQDLRRLVELVVGVVPFDAVHSSADEQATKHAGGLYPVVSKVEGVAPERILHIGDTYDVDVRRAREAGWTAVHLPRERAHRMQKAFGAVLGARSTLRRVW